ncbi:endonuclease domain-containing protein [Asticcacaulis sp. ZE23SCel15]|uniref:endonuclease domain-containing protein n=1 Tax=Asticcacaulis sp. ZE23SCel15 TaxID=3059027 RepID=UPI00265EB995|nr:endonuclease domain-containing protein [Asticcacaulis sp. ZE23SCel15]WKL57695.1 endonuclease domain-containing protein [Asticcacaulis sp. ZE23SCel15]
MAQPKYAFARTLRRNLTPPEYMLWQHLKLRLPDQPTFRRQFASGPYVLDFYCFKARLAIEVDGGFHSLGDQPAADETRDLWLMQQGIMIYRVPAADVFRDVDAVADGIRLLALERLNR